MTETQSAENDAVHLTPTDVVDAVGWDNRKALADLWQDHSPLPAAGLCDATYEALLAVARWGSRSTYEYGLPCPIPPAETGGA